jgi:RNA polymerase sigma-70 factor (ECF subfamily)
MLPCAPPCPHAPYECCHECARALVAAVQAGSSAAAAQLYLAYHGLVFRYVHSRVRMRPLAEDLTSETFVRMLHRIATFSWRGRGFGAWLVAIARNLIADHYKSARCRREFPTGQAPDCGGVEASPEERFLRYLSDRALMQALLRLCDRQRECITLRFLRGLSVAETADAMGKNEGAVKTLQYRAMRNLRGMLDVAA